MTTKQSLTQDRLKEVLHYDPETGVFTWKTHIATKVLVGDIAGTVDHTGQRRIGIDRKGYTASRLAYLYMTGEHPSRYVMHTNGIRADDRWENLKLSAEKPVRVPRFSKVKTGSKHRSSLTIN
jgi:hypothetical protein